MKCDCPDATGVARSFWSFGSRSFARQAGEPPFHEAHERRFPLHHRHSSGASGSPHRTVRAGGNFSVDQNADTTKELEQWQQGQPEDREVVTLDRLAEQDAWPLQSVAPDGGSNCGLIRLQHAG